MTCIPTVGWAKNIYAYYCGICMIAGWYTGITGVARNFDWGGGAKWKKFVTLFWWRHLAVVWWWRHKNDVITDFWSSISSQSAWKTIIWSNHLTSGHQYWSLRGAGGGEPSALGDFWKFVTKKRILGISQPKFSPKTWNNISIGGPAPPGYALDRDAPSRFEIDYTACQRYLCRISDFKSVKSQIKSNYSVFICLAYIWRRDSEKIIYCSSGSKQLHHSKNILKKTQNKKCQT